MANGISYGGPNPKPSGQDPRGRLQNQGGYMQKRYEDQQGPFASQLARDYGRASERQYGDYGDIMRRYGDVASGAGGGSGRGKVSWTDPFNSYGGYTEFSKTGGYSPSDIANMRSRGVAPVRAAYANAEREVSRGRALQGGYSPNAAAAQIKMAREQGQSGADAVQNVEAGLAEARNRGRLSGLGGMAGIEGQRLAAQLDAGKFNAMGDQQQDANKLSALHGMSSLYGTTPGMAQLFAGQLNASIGQAGQTGIQQQNADYNAQRLPGQWDTTMGRANDIMDTANRVGSAVYPWLRNSQQGQTGLQQIGQVSDPMQGSGQPQYPFTGPMQQEPWWKRMFNQQPGQV